MPQYFFHAIHSEHDTIRDETGLEFPDDTTALRAAIVSLAEMIKDSVDSHVVPYCVTVQVVREGGEIIDTVTGHLFLEHSLKLPRPGHHFGGTRPRS
jgi:hypothetical protein